MAIGWSGRSSAASWAWRSTASGCLRVMREQRLIQRRRREPRRRRPGFFRVERPDQLRHLNMTSVWVAAHGWCYLMAAIDCCTREIAAWSLELRCRADESIALIERAARSSSASSCSGPITAQRSPRGGSSSSFRGSVSPTAAAAIATPKAGVHRVVVRKAQGARDLALRIRDLDEARAAIGAHVDRYHHRPHSGLDYRTPNERHAPEAWNLPRGFEVETPADGAEAMARVEDFRPEVLVLDVMLPDLDGEIARRLCARHWRYG